MQHTQILSDEELRDMEYMDEIERLYPSDVYNRKNARSVMKRYTNE